MAVYSIDPLRDPRWGVLAQHHPRASVFHTPGWLEALERTYGYHPVAYTTTPPGQELTNGIVLCRINSKITGRRLVSLPFSDHCEPLVHTLEDLAGLLQFLKHACTEEGWRYFEVRPRTAWEVPPAGFQPSEHFSFHTVDLDPGLNQIFGRLHKESTQRTIRRAERERLVYQEGRSPALLEAFYRLLVRTRRRHQLPPPPRAWFTNLMHCLGDQGTIRVASKEGRPIASILTLRFKDVLVYKYGCSDERFHRLGGMHFLFWRAIQEGKQNGHREFDLGRSDSDNRGLITFKERWGASPSQLSYWRCPATRPRAAGAHWSIHMAKKIVARAPDRLLIAAGRMFYRHIG